MKRHLDTFRRHKIGLVLPIALAVLVSGWYATSQPHKYSGGMTVFFDTVAPNPSSLENPLGNNTPAAQGQAVLQEFLGTQKFLVNVGHRGPLAAYLATHTASAHGPSSLLSKLTSLGRKSGGSPPVDSQIVSILGNAFGVSVAGPQLVRIAMTAPDPSYIPGTLTAVAAEYQAEVTSNLQTRDQQSVAYYQSQLTDIQGKLSSDVAQVAAYQRQHPGVTVATDLTYSALTQVAVQDQNNYTTLYNSLQQAKLALQNVQGTTSFQVVDAPQDAFRLSSKKHMIFTVVAGTAAGLIISLLALNGLTALDKTARRQEDIEGALGMDVVATISELPRERRIPGLNKDQSRREHSS